MPVLKWSDLDDLGVAFFYKTPVWAFGTPQKECRFESHMLPKPISCHMRASAPGARRKNGNFGAVNSWCPIFWAAIHDGIGDGMGDGISETRSHDIYFLPSHDP